MEHIDEKDDEKNLTKDTRREKDAGKNNTFSDSR